MTLFLKVMMEIVIKYIATKYKKLWKGANEIEESPILILFTDFMKCLDQINVLKCIPTIIRFMVLTKLFNVEYRYTY
jgi:hypothetical protein